MKTAMLLMVRYDGLAVIPVERVCEDYFQHLSADKFIRKVDTGEIDYPARCVGERPSFLAVAPALYADQAGGGQIQGLEMAGGGDQMTETHEVGSEAWARNIERPYSGPTYARQAHNENFCCATVYGERVMSWQCNRKPAIWYGTLGYCRQHDPKARLDRDAARKAKMEAEYEETAARHAETRRKMALASEAVAALKQIAVGNNDPRTLALEVLARHNEPAA